MRIIHLLNHTRRYNGHVHAAVDLACAQKKLGHTVAVLSEGGDFDELLARHGIESVVISHQRRPWNLVKSCFRLRKYTSQWNADIVHAHMMTSAVLAWPACRLTGTPLITTVHNEFEKSAILMRLGTRVIAVSESVSESMAKRGVPRRKLNVVLNGTIGAARFDDRGTTPVTLGSPTVLFVGGLHPRKGLPDLLAAFDKVYAQFMNARLVIVGSGPISDEYKRMAKGLGSSDAIEFAGAQTDPYPWMLGADIFVLPSHADPAPLVLSEAREAGCAIVATAVDGIPELLDKGAAGILVPPKDPESLAKALCRLIGDPAELALWRQRSHANIARLTIDRVARDTLAVYASAMGVAAVPAPLTN